MTRILRGEGEDDIMGEEPKELGWFKRQCEKIDKHVLKPFLVYKYTTENVEAMNEIDAFMDEQENW